MSRMVSALFAHSPLLVLPLVGLGIFFFVFTVVVIRTMRRKAASYAEVAALPLADDASPGRLTTSSASSAVDSGAFRSES